MIRRIFMLAIAASLCACDDSGVIAPPQPSPPAPGGCVQTQRPIEPCMPDSECTPRPGHPCE